MGMGYGPNPMGRAPSRPYTHGGRLLDTHDADRLGWPERPVPWLAVVLLVVTALTTIGAAVWSAYLADDVEARGE